MIKCSWNILTLSVSFPVEVTTSNRTTHNGVPASAPNNNRDGGGGGWGASRELCLFYEFATMKKSDPMMLFP
jgi:hypothetical protein